MKSLIIYTTRYGCTEKCTNMLSKKLAGDVKVKNLATDKNPDLTIYELIVIGGQIMAGKINSKVDSFVNSSCRQ